MELRKGAARAAGAEAAARSHGLGGDAVDRDIRDEAKAGAGTERETWWRGQKLPGVEGSEKCKLRAKYHHRDY
jgi:hypothetical protein